MARKRTKLVLGEGEADRLREPVRAAIDPRDKERLQVVLWATGGQHTLAGQVRSTIQEWLDSFAAGGVGQLLVRETPARALSLIHHWLHNQANATP